MLVDFLLYFYLQIECQSYSIFLKQQTKTRSFSGYCLNLNVTALKHHDLLAQAQSDAGAIFTRTEKRVKNFIHHLVWDNGSVVDYLDNRTFSCIQGCRQDDVRF